MEQLVSRTTGNLWHKHSNNLHSVPLLELTLTLSLTEPNSLLKVTFAGVERETLNDERGTLQKNDGEQTPSVVNYQVIS